MVLLAPPHAKVGFVHANVDSNKDSTYQMRETVVILHNVSEAVYFY